MHGMNLYNVLRAMPLRLITHNVGNVDSIGNAVFLAGEKRYACPHSTFMFHGVGFDMTAGMRLEEKLLRERLDGVIADQRRIGSIIEEHSTLTDAQVSDLFREMQTKEVRVIPRGCFSTGHQVPTGFPVISARRLFGEGL